MAQPRKVDRGNVRRISTEAERYLNTRFRKKARESFDAFIRRVHGIQPRDTAPRRKRKPKKARRIYMVASKPPQFFTDRASAKGAAIMASVSLGKSKALRVTNFVESP